ncbi:MAG: glycoside hydrolase family 9 protein [Bacteroides sp.]|nr:glycoside hydrolase family 9 protein [Eubacterium sp.]MCM1418114.1 glycoside hydrolase family 9 protein [Roseburia sp.]MCM1462262.1 glycoside hydrolase family 9 protein [Bacteroides sp.]
MKKLLATFTLCAVLLTGCSQNYPDRMTTPTEEASGSDDAVPDETTDTDEADETIESGETDEIGDISETAETAGTTEPDRIDPSAEETSTQTNAGTTASAAQSNAGTTASTAQTNAGTTTTAATTTATKPTASTGKLSAYSTTYEGREQTSTYNYGEALQKSILFYDLQRSGDLPDDLRSNWRGDSCLNDGADVGLDLTGGFFDAGDHVKFNLPMSYTCTMLAWSVYEDRAAYEESGQLEYILDNIRWGNDYFIKCHPEANVYYYQVGDGSADHAWWGSAELLDAQMSRPSYKVDLQNCGSTVTASTAASLAACALVFKDSDPAYAETCIKHAKELLSYAESVKSDDGYTAANGFYTSHSGYVDQVAWAAYWLAEATGENSYLRKAKSYLSRTSDDYTWAHCWDDVSYGTTLLLAKKTGDQAYKDRIEKHLDYWLSGINYTPKGLAWLDQWGALRYSTTTAFLAASYAESDACPSAKKAKYEEFAKKQIDYALGSGGRSYVVGYGENPPKNPHHRTAHGAYTNNIGEPAETRHTLFGALVGGPDRNDGYTDDRNNYTSNEVACDYNAGFTGALAKLYKTYGGKTLVDFGAVEKADDDELYAEATVNVNGEDFIEIKALVYNKTATPARVTDHLKLCYFFDLSEVIAAGGSANDLTVTTNYMQGGSASGVNEWNKEKNLYYVAIDFDGVSIYPGSQESYKKEIQFRIRNNKGVWDNSNDPSYKDIAAASSGTLVKAYNMALYDGDTLVFGTEPNESNTGVTISSVHGSAGGENPSQNQDQNQNQDQGQNSRPNPTTPAANVSDKGTVSVELSQQATQGSANTIGFTIKVTNTGTTGIDLSKLEIGYLFTKDGAGDLNFWCDYADISGSGYQACTDTVQSKFTSASGSDRDTKCVMTASGVLAGGDTLQIQGRITKADWSNFDLGNDYSSGNSEHITVTYNGKELS